MGTSGEELEDGGKSKKMNFKLRNDRGNDNSIFCMQRGKTDEEIKKFEFAFFENSN